MKKKTTLPPQYSVYPLHFCPTLKYIHNRNYYNPQSYLPLVLSLSTSKISEGKGA